MVEKCTLCDRLAYGQHVLAAGAVWLCKRHAATFPHSSIIAVAD